MLSDRVGEANVAAIDPAPQFAVACRERHPQADVREGVAAEPAGRHRRRVHDLTGAGMTMLRMFWQAARTIDPNFSGEQHPPE